MKRSYHQRTIYVKPEDLAVFEEAAKMDDSLANIVAAALREYVGKNYVSKLKERRVPNDTP